MFNTSSIDPATTPFQNDYHSCQYKSDSGKRLNLLFFAVLVYCVEVEVVQVLWYLEIITICKCPWSIRTLCGGNARSVSLISYVVLYFFFLLQLFNNVFNDIYLYGIFSLSWPIKYADNERTGTQRTTRINTTMDYKTRIDYCLRLLFI